MGNQDHRNQWSISSFDSFETIPVVVTTDHRNQWSISFESVPVETNGVCGFSDIFFAIELLVVKVSMIDFAIQPFSQMYLLAMISFMKLYQAI